MWHSWNRTRKGKYQLPPVSPGSSAVSHEAGLEDELEREIQEVDRQLQSLRMSERKPIQSELDRAIFDLPKTPKGLRYVASDPVVRTKQPMAYSYKRDREELCEPRPTEVSIDPDMRMLNELRESTDKQITLLNKMLEEQRRLQAKIEGKKVKNEEDSHWPSDFFSTKAFVGTNSGEGAIGSLPAVATTNRVGSAPGDGGHRSVTHGE